MANIFPAIFGFIFTIIVFLWGVEFGRDKQSKVDEYRSVFMLKDLIDQLDEETKKKVWTVIDNKINLKEGQND